MSRLFTKAQFAKRFFNQVLLGSRRRVLYRAFKPNSRRLEAIASHHAASTA